MANSNDKPGTRLAKSNVYQERQIKVTRIHCEYKPKRNDGSIRSGQPVPWIRMKGKWLEQAGFSIDTPVKIRVMDGCLVLTKEE